MSTNIVLLCTNGMSTSLLVTKMRAEARKRQLDCSVNAYPMVKAEEVVPDADAVLIGPQERYNLRRLKKQYPEIPMESMNKELYLSQDGTAPLDLALRLASEKNK